MIIRTPRPVQTDTRQRLLVGKITKRGVGNRAETQVKGERYAALTFCLLTRKQLDARLAEAHRHERDAELMTWARRHADEISAERKRLGL